MTLRNGSVTKSAPVPPFPSAPATAGAKGRVPDWDEVRCGTDPRAATNYCVTILGTVSNTLPFAWNLRAGISLTSNGSVMQTATNATPTGGFELPHVTVNSAEALRVHLYDDLNTNAVLDAGEAFITQTPAITGAVVKVAFVISLATCDKDADGLPDFWEARHGLSWTNAPDACGNPDGDGLINLHEYWCRTDPQAADGAQYALSDAALAIDSRIAGRNPTNALPIFENYLANGANGVFIRNTNCWAADLDLTCCSPWNSYEGNKEAGTLISPRHVLFAAHYDQITNNSTLIFVDRQNNVITRSLVAKKRHEDYTPYYPDLTVGLLDSDVPTNQISFAKVLPDNYANYIRNGLRLPSIRLNQGEKALVGDVRSVVEIVNNNARSTFVAPWDETRASCYEVLVDYDSGNPAFVIFNDKPVLLTVWTGKTLGGYGTSVTALKPKINELMSDLGGGFQLSEVDLTNLTQTH